MRARASSTWHACALVVAALVACVQPPLVQGWAAAWLSSFSSMPPASRSPTASQSRVMTLRACAQEGRGGQRTPSGKSSGGRRGEAPLYNSVSKAVRGDGPGIDAGQKHGGVPRSSGRRSTPEQRKVQMEVNIRLMAATRPEQVKKKVNHKP